MVKKKKVKLGKKDSEELMPVIREFNKMANSFKQILGGRVERKEKKINIMISRIKRPDQMTHQVNVSSVKFTSGFMKKQQKKNKKSQQSEYDSGFNQKRGFII